MAAIEFFSGAFISRASSNAGTAEEPTVEGGRRFGKPTIL